METHGVTSNMILKISPNIITELVENMKCKVKDVAMVTEQEVAICKKYKNIYFSVTDKGIHKLDLERTIWGHNPDISLSSLLVSGTFCGLDILHPYTDFPLVVTTSAAENICTFLELRGNLE